LLLRVHAHFVVDESKLACFVLGRSLQRQGFDVGLAHSAEQALEDVARLEPAAVFMDHQMLGMSGLEAAASRAAASSSYRLTPDGMEAYLLEPVAPGGRCTASAADADVQQVANLSVR
jgi:CheY-like chemotaxis protein